MPSPIQLQRLPRRKKPAPTRALLFLMLLLIVLCSGLAGCSAQAADAPTTTTAELKRAAAGAWLCPGMHAEWLNEKEVMCLKETK
ncbi:hypothetical protein JAO85_13975 [Comamonas sp. NyZ500]|uniref:hypothetical protein n=1 Tax=Comamonas sp. NyZ500 TaxID=2795732 RepID=UPI00192BD267|nr:hypothetical protein [Comamonas sp. NyZ500]MBL5978393.1 hypothetical protein [Comamonas sp. NyZ500]